MTNLTSEDMVNAYIGIDEAEMVADSRMSLSKTNKLVTYWMYQSRKRNNVLMMCSHTLGAIDVRIRNETNYIIFPQGYDEQEDSLPYIIVQLIPTQKRTQKVLHNCTSIFELFNSYERIGNLRGENSPKRIDEY